jgi:hypothetical protein
MGGVLVELSESDLGEGVDYLDVVGHASERHYVV